MTDDDNAWFTDGTLRMILCLENGEDYPPNGRPCVRVRVSEWKPDGLRWLKRFSDADRAGQLKPGLWFGGVT
jgi:hypothetical protein